MSGCFALSAEKMRCYHVDRMYRLIEVSKMVLKPFNGHGIGPPIVNIENNVAMLRMSSSAKLVTTELFLTSH
jgi:hypothetical protein